VVSTARAPPENVPKCRPGKYKGLGAQGQLKRKNGSTASRDAATGGVKTPVRGPQVELGYGYKFSISTNLLMGKLRRPRSHGTIEKDKCDKKKKTLKTTKTRNERTGQASSEQQTATAQQHRASKGKGKTVLGNPKIERRGKAGGGM